MQRLIAVALVAAWAGAAEIPPPAAGGRRSADLVAEGRALYEGKGGCASCHAGERLGPDLTWIGVLRGDESLTRSLLEPDADVHPAFFTVVAQTGEGATVRGLKIREDDREIVVRDERGDHALRKADLASVDRERRSLMPSYAATLTKDELAAVVAYLRTRKAMWPIEPRERTREIPLLSENTPFFERSDRARTERTDDMVRAIGIAKGARIVDLGAGTGFYTWRLAEAAGPSGRVTAVDIQQKMLDLVAEAVDQHGLRNVDYVLATERDPKLAAGAYDMVFICHAYHEFTEPEAVMREVRRALKPGGRLFVLEYKAENPKAPASGLHRMSFEDLRAEIEPIGFALERIVDFLPTQHGLLFTVRD